MSIALSVKNLKKVYKGKIEALKGVDLEIKKGDFFALLGPNGAGKSTLINIVTDLVKKTEGEIKIFGHDFDAEKEKVKSFIGVVPQEFNFNIFEKVFDIVVWQAGYYGIDKKTAEKRAEKYLKELGLWEKKDAVSMTLSGGMKRRLMIARALVHEPELLILDEPTAGVDIETRKSMWEFIKNLNSEGKTIILTTHYLEEAENLCKNIAIIDKGKIIENTSMRSLLGKMDKETFILDIDKPLKIVPRLLGYKIKIIDESSIEVEISEKQSINKLFSYLDKHKINVLSMRRKTARLEELFTKLTGRKDEI
jgi:ABC-2 type transport system ATP-binding protein